jgi:alpha-amylase/alpha-mannosidase (GH57 family)
MHQPYYKNLLTQEADVPWVRLHGVKDYLDMLLVLQKYPDVHAIFNFVPSLVEQLMDYSNHTVKDKFLDLSLTPAADLSAQQKEFILDKFFSIEREKNIAVFPRYYELYFKKQAQREFTTQDFLDLQVWFNLAWIDPIFRKDIPELRSLVEKARFFTEEEKRVVLQKQIEIIKRIIPAYKQAIAQGQIEVILSPFYHPILPLLYDTDIAKEANPKTLIPKRRFSYPQDALAQIEEGIFSHQEHFGMHPSGMWPSEESVCEQILPFIIQSGMKWMVTDEAILFRSLKATKRDTKLLYQPYLLKREAGETAIVFRDRNLSDLIGFEYHRWNPQDAAADFLKHLENIATYFKRRDILVTIALDGENAWEYYKNDGHDFLDAFYQGLSQARFLKTVTMKEYLEKFSPRRTLRRLAAGSWIFGNYGKWIDNPYKVRAWECLTEAREAWETIIRSGDKLPRDVLQKAWKQIHIAEGSDWFWWYGEDPNGDFDRLFRMHLSNFYTLIGKEIPAYLHLPLAPQ